MNRSGQITSTIPWNSGLQDEVVGRINELREEVTQWTERAHSDVLAIAERQFGSLRPRVVGGLEFLFLPRYATVVLGQAFATQGDLRGGKRTGIGLDRCVAFRQSAIPIYLVVAQGPSVWAEFVHILGTPRHISHRDRAAGWQGRVGWTEREFGGRQSLSDFSFPEEVVDLELFKRERAWAGGKASPDDNIAWS